MDAILSAPDHLVRATLIALCSDRVQLSKAKDYLGKMGHTACLPAALPADDQSLKRKAEEDIKICVQCQEPFYEVDNEGKTPCKFHSGMFHTVATISIGSCECQAPSTRTTIRMCGTTGTSRAMVYRIPRRIERNIQMGLYGRAVERMGRIRAVPKASTRPRVQAVAGIQQLVLMRLVTHQANGLTRKKIAKTKMKLSRMKKK